MSAPVYISVSQVGSLTGHLEGQRHGRDSRHENVHHLDGSPHGRAMISTCWIIDRHAEFEERWLRPWAHMLPFRRHFATKTAATPRPLATYAKRARTGRIVAALGYPDHSQARRHRLYDPSDDQEDQDTILVIGQWQYQGIGRQPGDLEDGHAYR